MIREYLWPPALVFRDNFMALGVTARLSAPPVLLSSNSPVDPKAGRLSFLLS